MAGILSAGKDLRPVIMVSADVGGALTAMLDSGIKAPWPWRMSRPAGAPVSVVSLAIRRIADPVESRPSGAETKRHESAWQQVDVAALAQPA